MKATRAQQEANKLAGETHEYGQYVAEHLRDLLSGRAVVRAPPRA